MIKVEFCATVSYDCILSEEDEKKVRNYAERKEIPISEATKKLFYTDSINIYRGHEIEFFIDKIDDVDYD